MSLRSMKKTILQPLDPFLSPQPTHRKANLFPDDPLRGPLITVKTKYRTLFGVRKLNPEASLLPQRNFCLSHLFKYPSLS